MIQWQPWVTATLFLACLGSFSLAMRKFFVWPAGIPTGAMLITACGFVFGIIHLATILSMPAVTGLQLTCGAALYVSSLALFWWAIYTNLHKPLSAAFSPDLPAHLVAQGPYRFIRHPLYCSYLLSWAAGWMATGRLWLAPTVVVMFIIYVIAAAQEEKKFAASPMAVAYEQYRAATGLFLPNPLKFHAGKGRRYRTTAA